MDLPHHIKVLEARREDDAFVDSCRLAVAGRYMTEKASFAKACTQARMTVFSEIHLLLAGDA